MNDARNVDDVDLGGAGAVAAARALEGEGLVDGGLEQVEVPLDEEDVRHRHMRGIMCLTLEVAHCRSDLFVCCCLLLGLQRRYDVVRWATVARPAPTKLPLRMSLNCVSNVSQFCLNLVNL